MAEPAEAERWRSRLAARSRVRRLAVVPHEPPGDHAGSARESAGELTLELITELAGTDPGLARLLRRVLDNETPFVVVSPVAISGWRARVPEAWTRAENWLRDHGIAIIEV
jgi:hypothetical protein